VDAEAAMGGATKTRTATGPGVGSTRCRRDCRVTLAEMENKEDADYELRESFENGRRAGMSKPR
jgi:hypothetical protein